MKQVILTALCLILAASSIAAEEKDPKVVYQEMLDSGEAALKGQRFKDAINIFDKAIRKGPWNEFANYGMARAQEGFGNTEAALGYYATVLSLIKGRENTPERTKAFKYSEKKVSALNTYTQKIDLILNEFNREMTKLAKELERKGDLEEASEICRTLTNANPTKAEYAGEYYRLAAAAKRGQIPPPPKGYEALFNNTDLSGWDIRDGNWFVKNRITTNPAWGFIIMPERYFNYKLKMVYRTEDFKIEEKEEQPRLLIHLDPDKHNTCARVALTGKDTGMIWGIIPETKYTEGAENDQHLTKPSPFKAGEWMEIEVQVKNRVIKVKLNGKTIFETDKNNRIPDGQGRASRNFPGHLAIHNPKCMLEIKTLYFDGGKKAK